jgi:predicted outer membrane protein
MKIKINRKELITEARRLQELAGVQKINKENRRYFQSDKSTYEQLMDTVDDLFPPDTEENEKLKDAVTDEYNGGWMDDFELSHSPNSYTKQVKDIAKNIGLELNELAPDQVAGLAGAATGALGLLGAAGAAVKQEYNKIMKDNPGMSKIEAAKQALKKSGKNLTGQFGSLSEKEETVNEIDAELLDRIEGLVIIKELENFKESLQVMTDDLVDEGFEYHEIKAYFQSIIDEQLGRFIN